MYNNNIIIARYNDFIFTINNSYISNQLLDIYSKIQDSSGLIEIKDICSVYLSFDEDIDDDKIIFEIKRDYIHYINLYKDKKESITYKISGDQFFIHFNNYFKNKKYNNYNLEQYQEKQY